MNLKVAAILAVAFLNATAFANDLLPGQLLLDKKCPGDDTSAAAPDELGGVLTALLTGLVSQGIKTAGAKLTAAAQEQSIDVLHIGDYLYTKASKGFVLKDRCLIVLSKATNKSGRTLAEFAKDYQKAVWSGRTSLGIRNATWSNGAADFAGFLAEQGYKGQLLPGVVAVFDIELSSQGTEIRLLPRFIGVDHSVREEKTDNKPRTFSFQLTYASPGAEKPFGSQLIKFDRLVIGEPYVWTHSEADGKRRREQPMPQIYSQWITLPDVDGIAQKKVEASEKASEGLKSRKSMAELAGNAAVMLGDAKIGTWVNSLPPCPSDQIAKKNWITEATNLQIEQAKMKADIDLKLVSRYTQAALYYKNCFLYRSYESTLGNQALPDGFDAKPYDITVDIKEFRKRPFAQFFGAVLSDETTGTALTTALINEIDPATRKSLKEKAGEEELAERVAFEDAVVAAETAVAAFESAKPEEKLVKMVDRDAKKRAANRIADKLGMTAPYPDAPIWISLGE